MMIRRDSIAFELTTDTFNNWKDLSQVIYEPFSDEGYESVGPTKIEDIERLAALDGSPRGAAWQPIPVERVTADDHGRPLPEADFPGASLALIGHRRAVDALRSFLSGRVEFLPLRTADGTELYVFNVLNTLDALDEQRSDIARFENGRIMHIRKAVFKPELIAGADIFRLRHLAARTYVSHRFVRAVSDAGLTGLTFELLWGS